MNMKSIKNMTIIHKHENKVTFMKYTLYISEV